MHFLHCGCWLAGSSPVINVKCFDMISHFGMGVKDFADNRLKTEWSISLMISVNPNYLLYYVTVALYGITSTDGHWL